jgi:nucleoporin POM34
LLVAYIAATSKPIGFIMASLVRMTPTRRSLTPATPTTPASQTGVKAPRTGTWRHPKFDEITKRQYARTFSEQNAKAVLVNALYLFSTFIVPSFASGWRILYVVPPFQAN